MTDLDSVIDAAAREITGATSPVNLRARVLEEIRSGADEAKASYDIASYHMGWLAAAAGILLAVYLGWPARPTIEFPPSPMVHTHDGPRPPTPTPMEPVAARRDSRTPAPPALDPAIASISALDGPGAIGIAPLDATSDTLPALDAVEPLDLEQLDIKPLTPPGPAAGGQ